MSRDHVFVNNNDSEREINVNMLKTMLSKN